MSTNRDPAHLPTPSDAGPVNEEARHNATERRRLIAERAYLIAERRGFEPGHAVDDWLEAEKQIDHMLEARGTPL